MTLFTLQALMLFYTPASTMNKVVSHETQAKSKLRLSFLCLCLDMICLRDTLITTLSVHSDDHLISVNILGIKKKKEAPTCFPLRHIICLLVHKL